MIVLAIVLVLSVVSMQYKADGVRELLSELWAETNKTKVY